MSLALVGLTAAALLLVGGKRKSRRRPEIDDDEDTIVILGDELPDEGSVAGYDYRIEYVNAEPGDDVPTLVLFHGLGVTPEQMEELLLPDLDGSARVIIPTGKNLYGPNPAWWTARAAKDQGRLAAQMAWTLDDFHPALDAFADAYGSLVLVGHSQGAMMAAALASQYPELVDSAVVASPWVPEALWSAESATIAAVHGLSDRTIPYQRTADWLTQMAEEGAPVELWDADAGHSLGDPDLRESWAALVDEWTG